MPPSLVSLPPLVRSAWYIEGFRTHLGPTPSYPTATGQTDDFTAELFSPPNLFKSDGTAAARPVISSAPTAVTYGQVFTVKTTSASSIAKVTWIRLSAVTHSFNQSQRMNLLTFTKGTGQISVAAPATFNLAPPGHYLLSS